MDLDFDIDGLTKRIAEFYAQQRARGVAVPQRRTVTLQFPDGLMAYACDIAQQVHDALSVWLHLPFLLFSSANLCQ